jgi:hypothetical protein
MPEAPLMSTRRLLSFESGRRGTGRGTRAVGGGADAGVGAGLADGTGTRLLAMAAA